VDDWKEDLIPSFIHQPFALKLLSEKPSKILKLTDVQLEKEISNFVIEYLNCKISKSVNEKSNNKTTDEIIRLIGTAIFFFGLSKLHSKL
jgi:hypothetical protein